MISDWNWKMSQVVNKFKVISSIFSLYQHHSSICLVPKHIHRPSLDSPGTHSHKPPKILTSVSAHVYRRRRPRSDPSCDRVNEFSYFRFLGDPSKWRPPFLLFRHIYDKPSGVIAVELDILLHHSFCILYCVTDCIRFNSHPNHLSGLPACNQANGTDTYYASKAFSFWSVQPVAGPY